MLEIPETTSRKRWVRKWEPHKHCSVCGLAMEADSESEFCSVECEAKYTKWEKKRKKKDKTFTYIMIGSIIVIVIFMIVLPLFSG